MSLKTDIQRHLKESGLKPYQIADLARIPRTSIYRYLAGTRGLNLATAEKIRKVIDRGNGNPA